MIDDSYLPSGGSGYTAMALAIIHALPMLGVAAWTRSKLLIVLTGIGMVGVAIAIGGARYAVIDLFFVALGTWGAFRLCVPKGLSAQQRRVIENVLDGPQAINGESELTENEQELLRKLTKYIELERAFESMGDEQQDAFVETMTCAEIQTLQDLVETAEKVAVLAPNSNFAREYKKETQRKAEEGDRKLQIAAERAAARINAYREQHPDDFGDTSPSRGTTAHHPGGSAVAKITGEEILAILNEPESKKR
jgi:hypothetical protein